MRAYSLDLRERVVAAYEKGEETIAGIAAKFSVGQTFLKKMLRQKRATGSLERLPQRAGAKKVLSDKHRSFLAKQIKKQPDATLAELQTDLQIRDRCRLVRQPSAVSYGLCACRVKKVVDCQ